MMKKGLKLKGRLRLYLNWPIWLTVLLLMMVMQLFAADRKSGLIGTCYVIVFFLFAVVLRYTGHRKIRRDLIHFASTYGQMQMQVMKELTVPFAILNEEGQLLWGNDQFVAVAVNKKAARRNIANVFPEITETRLPLDGEEKIVHVRCQDQYYRAVLSLVSDDGFVQDEQLMPMDQLVETKKLITLFLYDETEMIEAEEKREAENLIVGLLYIDNYDEMIDSIDEVRQSLMTALIDRKINKTMQSIDAISKKMEKDKFLFVFKQSYLQGLIDNRFAILEDIRNINIGNEQTATISIGIGVGKGSYDERYDWARAAIDLALGRGGDQAVIKSGDQEQFFGGKRVQIERNTRVKARVKAHALRELIEGKERVIVMGHSIGDADSFGASVGIYRIATALNRKAHIVVDEVNASVKPIKERFYTGDYESDMLIDGEEAKELMDESTLLVIVDVNKGEHTECPELIDMAQSVVVIDHHRQAGDAIAKAVLFYIEPYASSASEMVAEICQYIGGGVKLRAAEAEAMYSGIMIDTNYFTDKTGVRTFEAMAYLKRNGVDSVRIRKMFREDINEYKIRAAAIQDTELYLDHYAIAECSSRDVESPTVLGAKIANSLLDIDKVKASFVLTKYNGKVYISARSIDELNVQVMMEKFHGGGHINMAGAQVPGLDVDGVKEQIRQLIDEMIADGDAD
ncbi:MAG: DHH family phosphoesterase [Lachnospiraceae bacterium]|nr:DHH family phosphoesterase [Lachnospiraceae bacterium]